MVGLCWKIEAKKIREGSCGQLGNAVDDWEIQMDR